LSGKLARLDDKDKSFIEAYHSARPLDPRIIEERIRLSNFESKIADRARVYIRNLTRKIADPSQTDDGAKAERT
jgi:hypothetical protein